MRWRWFQMSVRSRSSYRHVCTQRSMIDFILGIWTPLSTVSIPASVSTVSNRPGNLPSRSRIKNRARLPASSRSMARFRAAWMTQDAVGSGVVPRIRILCRSNIELCSLSWGYAAWWYSLITLRRQAFGGRIAGRPRPGRAASRCPEAAAAGTGAACGCCNGHVLAGHQVRVAATEYQGPVQQSAAEGPDDALLGGSVNEY
jgi:hypothetical protein